MTTSNIKAIMDELKYFYCELYNNRAEDDIEELSNPFFNNPQITQLSSILRNACEELLTVAECLNTLSYYTFLKRRGWCRGKDLFLQILRSPVRFPTWSRVEYLGDLLSR